MRMVGSATNAVPGLLVTYVTVRQTSTSVNQTCVSMEEPAAVKMR